MELAKSFEPADIERHWYPRWEEKGYFAAGLDTNKTDNFCILLPPPNVTGTLHKFGQKAVTDFIKQFPTAEQREE